MGSEVEVICKAAARLGEGPLWDWREECLWWVDILGQSLHRHDPRSRTNSHFDVGRLIGTVVVRESGVLVLACADGFQAFDPKTRSLAALGHPEADLPGNRFNDGKCDPRGTRLFGRHGDRRCGHALGRHVGRVARGGV